MNNIIISKWNMINYWVLHHYVHLKIVAYILHVLTCFTETTRRNTSTSTRLWQIHRRCPKPDAHERRRQTVYPGIPADQSLPRPADADQGPDREVGQVCSGAPSVRQSVLGAEGVARAGGGALGVMPAAGRWPGLHGGEEGHNTGKGCYLVKNGVVHTIWTWKLSYKSKAWCKACYYH